MITLKKIIQKTFFAFPVVLLFLMFTGCGSNNQKQQKSNEVPQIEQKEEVAKDVIEYPIPTSMEVTKLLNEAGASYILGISNDAANAEKYFTQRKKALNLGIYGADLSYAATYNQTQETMDYLHASQKLISELNITTAFNNKLADRIEANIQNNDSLIKIITNSFYDTYQYMVKNDRDIQSLLVMTGSWIEGMYITTQINITASKNLKIEDIILNQKASLQKLLDLMQPVKNNEDIKGVYDALSGINAVYMQLNSDNQKAAVATITTDIENIRNKIIEPAS
ncbi:MAG TPA: hypothetical protein VE912_25290 [Bacteroidales bacterium]|nr:hypothetical protein [Bacteroidales bacterium]